jgi:hypothetical protein
MLQNKEQLKTQKAKQQVRALSGRQNHEHSSAILLTSPLRRHLPAAKLVQQQPPQQAPAEQQEVPPATPSQQLEPAGYQPTSLTR